ncbi:PTS sugar transporter subunit IIB [Histophilus somni]|uniref:PTS sugar transporter subunit IIB n=1 Tax=Histophilus somni TaxID=731 RepID=A0AAX2S2U7_HISSO|nr:PTS sugar transporter subunit IIB [Histophilus somni]QEH08168.1 PTS sugar transporter subunit IIB [Histophilus somni]QEH13254.1 PTS sugar transporter subunit IIB [Histophilus somni]QEH24438.1 PTS sugar transporter subunit IIB [Histophilus somni]QEH27734.1 PTS sugar transporter subunit IIB [Histophilus somni]QEH51936.1 PTS sugar transporter subunit IIB [Histophilus somni]
MKRILLICDLGMSTSLVVKRMKQAAEAQGLPVEIEAKGMQSFHSLIQDFDCVLLGPQISYKLQECQTIGAEFGKPVACIDMMSYGMTDGEKILAQALSLLEEK